MSKKEGRGNKAMQNTSRFILSFKICIYYEDNHKEYGLNKQNNNKSL